MVSRFMLNWLGYVLLGAALALGVVALVTAALRLGRLAATPRPVADPRAGGSRPAQPTGGQPKPQGPGGGLGSAPAPAKPPESAAPPAPAAIPQGQRESFIDRQQPRGGG